MTYFADLAPYSYSYDRRGQLSVGWLDESHPFPAGDVSPLFLDKLKTLCKEKIVRQTKGMHFCETCKKQSGSAEIEVIGENGVIYAAPTLIFHYVKDHHYLPPEEFIQAVLNT